MMILPSSIESLPDLIFDDINASKGGAYLHFHFEVLNRGLKSADNVFVGIYADDKFVDEFELNTIAVGAKKIIDVENLKVPLNAQKIEFRIDPRKEISEISEDNNVVALATTD
jgi:subtilase family serine protease